MSGWADLDRRFPTFVACLKHPENRKAQIPALMMKTRETGIAKRLILTLEFSTYTDCLTDPTRRLVFLTL